MILLALVGGAMLSMQAAINGRLGSQVGVFRSAFLTFAVGALITALLIFILPPSVDNAAGCAEMAAAGRILRVPYIVIMVVAVQRIGTATATVAVIFGQLAMSLLIDNFGWLGNDAIAFSAGRLGAIVCLGLALFFIYRSSAAAKAEDKES
jgi:transporter family-2 protein